LFGWAGSRRTAVGSPAAGKAVLRRVRRAWPRAAWSRLRRRGNGPGDFAASLDGLGLQGVDFPGHRFLNRNADSALGLIDPSAWD